MWKVGVVMAAPTSSVATSAPGPRSRGSGFVRVVFVVIVAAFIVRIGGDLAGLW